MSGTRSARISFQPTQVSSDQSHPEPPEHERPCESQTALRVRQLVQPPLPWARRPRDSPSVKISSRPISETGRKATDASAKRIIRPDHLALVIFCTAAKATLPPASPVK